MGLYPHLPKYIVEVALDYDLNKVKPTSAQKRALNARHHQPKYLVVYTIGDSVFTQQYNSIREIRDDTGLKRRKFISNKTTNISI